MAVSVSDSARILPRMYANYLDVSTCVLFLNGLRFLATLSYVFMYASASPSGDGCQSVDQPRKAHTRHGQSHRLRTELEP